jgi:SAM-dependent methyltransferase
MEPSQYQLVFQLEERYWWHVGLREFVLTCLGESLPRAGDVRILDAGCGSGMLLQALRLRGYAHVVGIDTAPQAVDLAQRRGLPCLIRGSVERLPFRDATFDAVASLDVLSHRGVASDVGAIREVHRVLKPQGLFLLHLAAYDFLRGPHDLVAHTRHRYRKGEVRAKLEQAGFRVLRLTYRNSLLFPVALVRRLLARRGVGAGRRSDVIPLSRPLNTVLTAVMRLENRLVHARSSLPCGLSVFCLARKS